MKFILLCGALVIISLTIRELREIRSINKNSDS